MSGERLLSVGIDIGTTTTQLVISRLTLRSEDAALTAPRVSIAEKEVLYRSAVRFTPLLSDTQLDAAGVREIVEEAYAASGYDRKDIRTGAVIITGETARRENAREVLRALSDLAGDLVVATAGPSLESVLAGKGSGAQAYSEKHHCKVLNIDIGGGTSNFALFEDGALRGVGCLNVGGRLIRLTPEGVLTYLSPVLRPYFGFSEGQRLGEEELAPVARFLAGVLQWAVTGRADVRFRAEDFVVEPPPRCEDALLCFSGGVADLIAPQASDLFAYGDLGVLLGQAIYRSPLCGGRFLRAKETIRAAVIGAGSHATELSGSAVFCDHVTFPLKNLPVAALRAEDEALEPEQLAEKIREKTALYAPEGALVLGLHGQENPRFSDLCKLADGIALGLQTAAEAGNPLVLAVEADMGGALGQAVGMLLPEAPLVCLDGVRLPEGAYLDIGAPASDGQALPVVVKTLALGG